MDGQEENQRARERHEKTRKTKKRGKGARERVTAMHEKASHCRATVLRDTPFRTGAFCAFLLWPI